MNSLSKVALFTLISGAVFAVQAADPHAGMAMHEQPAANAGASFHAAETSAPFHGVMSAATPTGSLARPANWLSNQESPAGSGRRAVEDSAQTSQYCRKSGCLVAVSPMHMSAKLPSGNCRDTVA